MQKSLNIITNKQNSVSIYDLIVCAIYLALPY